MGSSRKLELHCPAKVNLALSVGSPVSYATDSLHPIASWMAALEFADRLTLETARGRATFDIRFDEDVTGKVDWPLEKDLAHRAYVLLCDHVGQTLPVDLKLRKRIPAGSGLGGGSSDAAAVLVGLNRLFGLNLTGQTLLDLALGLGSDVAFLVGAISGQPSALVTGFGERIEPLPRHESIHLVLIFPGFGCPTGAVYTALDQARRDAEVHHSAADEASVRKVMSRIPVPPNAPFNDLAEAAWRVRSKLGKIYANLSEKLRVPVHITGSGSTLFVITPTPEQAKELARIVPDISGLSAVATRTL